MTIQEKLRWLLETSNRAAVCRKAGISQPTLCNLLTRGSTPGIDTALKLARTLNVDVGWLVDDSIGLPPRRIEPAAVPAPPVREPVAA
jgi:transcriptional regulator with XRE-family HTH domain